MKFRFELNVKKMLWPIHHQHRLFLIGSCFTENIGEKLVSAKFETIENPHGILFNPVSVAKAMDDYIQNRQYTAANLFYYNEAWHSWDHHSRFSGITEADAIDKINKAIAAAHTYLKQADYCFITLGSAWTYELTNNAPGAVTGKVAANNHKGPTDWFQRRLLTAPQVTAVLQQMHAALTAFNPGFKILFTISPVRHLREGAVENNRSKAVLLQAVHDLVDTTDNCYYFPAYELVIDDLRDYRYYAEDLVHPNYQATQYVWEKFVEACTTPAAQKLIADLAEIRLAFAHKPFNASSAQHQKFLQTYLGKTRLLQQLHPYLNLKKEILYFGAATKQME
jgi:hypothetical protein